MRLLGAKLYDPSTAGSASTASLLAITAIDTTNLRIAFTIPSHGMVRVKAHCIVHGATTFPTILLGVLEGSTVRCRVSPTKSLGNTAVATAQVSQDIDVIITGLTPGAVNWDLAYGVEIVVASTAIKWGGPNNTTTNDAFGGITFEVWDPDPWSATGTPVISVNTTQISGDTVAADNAESFFDGTGYAGTNNTIPTVTNVTTKTGYSLSSAGIQAIWDALTSALTTVGSIGKLLVDNINATISSRSSHSAADVWAVATRLLTAGTNIVLAKGVGVTGFNDLDAAGVRSAVGLASANLDTQLDALPTALENADAVWDEATAGHSTPGTTGKALIDAGSAGDPWSTALPGAYGAGTAGKIIGDNLNATVSSRATSADIPSASIIADAVLDEDMTAHQTLGSLGQAIGDPGADSDTIWGLANNYLDASVSSRLAGVSYTAPDNATIANIQTDTNDIQSRLPAALSGDGFIKADLKSIDDELTNGNNATLNLKKLDILNTDNGSAISAIATGAFGAGIYAQGASSGGSGIEMYGDGGFSAIFAEALSGNAHGLELKGIGTGKSINSPNDISISDGDLTLTNIAKKILTLDWAAVTGEAVRSALNAFRKLRNKTSFNGINTLTVYKEDGVTPAYTQTVTSDSDQEPFKELGN